MTLAFSRVSYNVAVQCLHPSAQGLNEHVTAQDFSHTLNTVCRWRREYDINPCKCNTKNLLVNISRLISLISETKIGMRVVYLTFFLTFHFDMKLPEQVLQFALECAHVLQKTDNTHHINSPLLRKTRTTIAIKLSTDFDKDSRHKTAEKSGELVSALWTGVCVCVCVSLWFKKVIL